MINEAGLWRLIDERIKNLGLTREEADIQAFCVNVLSYYQEVKLFQDTVILVNPVIDIPYYAQLIIDGGNNKLETSREDYEKLAYAGYQCFEDQINIHTNNFGIDFIPYRLEFIRISPNKKQTR